MSRPWCERQVWALVADEIREYREAGFGGMLTEDSVRFCIARSLVNASVDVARLRVEAPHPAARGARVDLTVGHPSPVAVIEVKYPREPNPAAAAWTTTLGEVLKDFYRLAAYPGKCDRIFVYLEGERLRRYMAGIAQRHGLTLDADYITLRPDAVATLPATATTMLDTSWTSRCVTARRVALVAVDDTLRFAIYHVEAASDGIAEPTPAAIALPKPETAHRGGGVRGEILDAIHAVLTRSGSQTFTPAQIVAEMAHRGTRYAESTIRTMITGHLCRNAPNNAGTNYDDLERVDRGHYRLAT